MAEFLNKRHVCMQWTLNQLLFYNCARFDYVMKNKLINKSSRDSCKRISEKCCRTYQCNAKKCIQSDPEAETLTPDTIYRRNYHMWIKGKHLMCDLMKKHINTKKNDIQPALKKMFEWFNWELDNYPCPCEKCVDLKLFLKTDAINRVQHRCRNCLCGLEEHEKLEFSCHINGVCQGRKMCSYCFKYKPQCNFGFMLKYVKNEVALKKFRLLNFMCNTSVFICNTCFITSKRNKFMNLLNKREKLTKTLNPEDKKIGKRKRAVKNILPNDILYQDKNWEQSIDYTFLETRNRLKKQIDKLKEVQHDLRQSKKTKVAEFINKVKQVKQGICNDVTFIEQMVMLVEKKTRENIKVDVEKGIVNLIS